MTTMPTGPRMTRPDLVVPAAVPIEQAIRKVARRLPDSVDLTARIYHHPFLGLVFSCRAATGRLSRRSPCPPVMAHVVVDLVGGRAFLSDPWDAESFTAQQVTPGADGADWTDTGGTRVRGPAPQIAETSAIEAGRDLLTGVLIRRRRLDGAGGAELHESPVHFGKPNWWVTGQNGERSVEVIVDALSGLHYAYSG